MPPSGNIVYTQPWIQTGELFASQNDVNMFGNYVTDFDDFTLSTTTNITAVAWTGGYFNPPLQAPLLRWNVTIWADNAGQPGAKIFTQQTPGTGNETFLGMFPDQNGVPTPIFTYFVDFPFQAIGGTKYWLSVVPDVGFPPEWGWALGTGGDGVFWQSFFGVLTEFPNDLAFTLYAGGSGPPPSGQSAFFKIQKLVVSVKQDNIPVRGRNK